MVVRTATGEPGVEEPVRRVAPRRGGQLDRVEGAWWQIDETPVASCLTAGLLAAAAESLIGLPFLGRYVLRTAPLLIRAAAELHAGHRRVRL